MGESANEEPGDVARCAALLRAVNVGGRKLKMAELRAALEDAGFAGAETLLASGNVVLPAPPEGAESVGPRIETLVAERFDLHSDVLVRDHAQLKAALARHPFRGDEEQGRYLHVVFLRDEPDPARIATLDPDRSPPDRVAVLGREAYLHYPEGSGRSKLTLDWLERQLGTVGTGRNLNTVEKLVALTEPGRAP